MHGVFSTCCTPLSALLHVPFQALISPHSSIYLNDLHRQYHSLNHLLLHNPSLCSAICSLLQVKSIPGIVLCRT